MDCNVYWLINECTENVRYILERKSKPSGLNKLLRSTWVKLGSNYDSTQIYNRVMRLAYFVFTINRLTDTLSRLT